MVNPAYWALMPISMKSEKCVGITLTLPGSKNFPTNPFLTRFDSHPKDNHVAAISSGFVSAEVSVRTEITGIRDRKLPGVEAWGHRDSGQQLLGFEAWGHRDARQILPGLETVISRQEGETLRVSRNQLPTLFTNSKKQQ